MYKHCKYLVHNHHLSLSTFKLTINKYIIFTSKLHPSFASVCIQNTQRSGYYILVCVFNSFSFCITRPPWRYGSTLTNIKTYNVSIKSGQMNNLYERVPY